MSAPYLRLLAAASLLAALGDVASADTEMRDHRSDASSPGFVETTPRVYRRRPGPRFMMPLKIDLGAVGVNTSRGFAEGIGGSIGIHWASLSPEPTNTDVGVGVFGAIVGAPAAQPDGTMMTTDKSTAAYGGAYLELGHTLAQGSFWRTWATGRGEYLASGAFGNEGHTGFGASGRLSAELFASGVGIEPRGLFLGTYAIGAYVEAGVRDVASDLSAVQVSAGLTFRTPLVFAP